MGFDALVANAGRLNILTALAVEERQEFVQLRQRTALTDGNLACHARRLATAGLIEINKSFRDGKPVTSMTLTTAGRSALEAACPASFGGHQPSADSDSSCFVCRVCRDPRILIAATEFLPISIEKS